MVTWITLVAVFFVIAALIWLYLWLDTRQARQRFNQFADPSEMVSLQERRREAENWETLDHSHDFGQPRR